MEIVLPKNWKSLSMEEQKEWIEQQIKTPDRIQLSSLPVDADEIVAYMRKNGKTADMLRIQSPKGKLLHCPPKNPKKHVIFSLKDSKSFIEVFYYDGDDKDNWDDETGEDLKLYILVNESYFRLRSYEWSRLTGSLNSLGNKTIWNHRKKPKKHQKKV